MSDQVLAITLDLDEWVWQYNYERAHSGKYCYGKTWTYPKFCVNDKISL